MKIDFGSLTGTDILKNALIITLVAIVIFQRQCNQKSPLGDLGVKSTVKYVHDTITIASQPQKPQLNYIDTGSAHFITVPQKIDTPAIVRQYLKTYQYIQQFNAKQYNATFRAYVSHDSIYSPNLSVTWLSPTETINQITETAPAEKLKVFLGFHVGGSTSQFSPGPEAWLLTKTDHLYGISNNLALKQPNAELHVEWKLHL